MDIPPLSPEVLAHYHKRVPGLHKVDGIPWHGTMFPLDDFKMRDSDVLVTGYPKSGNNWLGEIVYMILIGGDETIANRKKIEERIHWLELDPVKPEEDSIGRFLEYPSPRVLMTHNPAWQCPQREKQKFKTVVIIRNPKDVVVSYFKFHQMLDFIRYDGSWDDFLSLFMHGEVMHGLWFDVVLDWWKRQDDPTVCFVKYEDLKMDLKAGVQKLAEFLGVSLEAGQVSDIVRHCTFGNMKANPMSNLSTEFMDESVSPFLRKGVIGDWKNYFTVAQSEMFDKMYEYKMMGTGLYLDFE